MATHHKKGKSIWDPAIVRRATLDSLIKLHPRTMAKNPVMFVVEVGCVLTTLALVRDAIQERGGLGFEVQITFWLWLTVLFANFAEAMAEGRGKAQAETLRRTRTETVANRLGPNDAAKQATWVVVNTSTSQWPFWRTNWADPEVQAKRHAAEMCEILIPEYVALPFIKNLPNG